jgi:hypothetical protein
VSIEDAINRVNAYTSAVQGAVIVATNATDVFNALALAPPLTLVAPHLGKQGDQNSPIPTGPIVGIPHSSLFGGSGDTSPGGGDTAEDTAAPPAEGESALNALDADFDEREKGLREMIDARKAHLEDEQKGIDEATRHVEALQDAVANATRGLDQMAEQAGLTETSGAGAVVKKLNDQLREAQEKMQYLRDTGQAGTQVTAQQKLIDDLTKKADEAQKTLRVASYEFTHSQAYEAQQALIAKQQKEAELAQARAEKERIRLENEKAESERLAEKLQALEDERGKQRAILDKKKADEDVQLLTATQTQILEHHTTVVQNIAQVMVGSFYATMKVAQDQAAVVADIAATAAADISGSADEAVNNINDAYQHLSDLVDSIGGDSFGSEGFAFGGERSGGAVLANLAKDWVDAAAKLQQKMNDPTARIDFLRIREDFEHTFGRLYGQFDALLRQARLRQTSHIPPKSPFRPSSPSLSSLSSSGSLSG